MNVENFILIVYGPTAVGKTDFVDELALRIPSEIVNIDMGQFYQPLTIGTAKPNWKEAAVPHHLFDLLAEPVYFSAWRYRDILKSTLSSIWQKGKIPILVGGSTFYLSSLFFPPLQVKKRTINKKHADNTWEMLHKIDPVRAKEIDPSDTYRVDRALDIWYSTGTKPSQLKPVYDPISDFYLICLTRNRADLYERINQRVGQMVDEGWPNEVRALIGTKWEPFLVDKKIMGYDILLSSIKGEIDQEDAITIIQKKTRNYAKRQMTFWRMLCQKLENKIDGSRNTIKQIDLTHLDIHRYISQLILQIKSILDKEV